MAIPKVQRIHAVGNQHIQVFNPLFFIIKPGETFRRIRIFVYTMSRQVGHPFASLVKLEDYPFALEVEEETFKMSEEMFSFLTEEADKRGIFVIQMFYNIILSKPFAEHYDPVFSVLKWYCVVHV